VHLQAEDSYQEWAQRLRRWRLNHFAAAFLEASGPLNLIGAQLVYLGQPLLNSLIPNRHLDCLARLLEDPSRIRAFIDYLQEESAW
jgi:hypothetical protein